MKCQLVFLVSFLGSTLASVIDFGPKKINPLPDNIDAPSSDEEPRSHRQLERIFGLAQNNNAVLATLHYARATVVIYNTQTTTAWKSCYIGMKTVVCSKRKREIATSGLIPGESTELQNGLIEVVKDGVHTVAPAAYYEQLEEEMEKALLEASEREAKETRLLDAIEHLPSSGSTSNDITVELESSAGELSSDRRARSVDDPAGGLDPETEEAHLRYQMGFWGLGGSNSNEPIHLAKTSTTTVVSTVFDTRFGTQIVTINYQRCVAPGSPVNPTC